MLYCIRRLSLIPLFCAPLLYAQPLQKTFSNWQITCNNLNSCEVRSISGSRGLVMTLVRHAGKEDSPLLRIDYGNRSSSKQSREALQDNLLLDGQPLRLDLSAWQTAPQHLMTMQMPAIHQFLGQIMNGDRLQLRHPADAVIALNGLKAALLLMDEIQGRTGGNSAWAWRGQRPAEDVPAAPALPITSPPSRPPPPLTPEETRGLIDFGSVHVHSDSCSLDVRRREVAVSPLTEDKALLLVGCEMGAYNTIDLAFEVSRKPPYTANGLTLTLPFLPPGQSDRQLELINPEYDALHGELLTFSKTRGLGDCGVATRWQFNGQNFVLAEYTQESTCDAWNSSEYWPSLWVSRQAEPQGRVVIQP